MTEPKPAAVPPDEAKTKTCQSCGQTYAYPVPGSLATRFHCELCAGLPEPVRRVFEVQQRRLRQLEKQIQKLKPSTGA